MGMMMRFWLSFLAILLYMGLWALPILAATTFFDDDVMVFVILPMAALIFLLMPLFVDRCAKHIFYFKTTVRPSVAEADLRKEILSMNFHDLPIVVMEKGKKLVVTWKYLDAKWWEVMSKQGVREAFTLVLRFDDTRRRVTMTAIFRSVRWGAGPTKVRFSWSFFRGVYLNYKIGAAWGIRENFTLGKIYSFKFDSEEIHNPVMNTILRSGWDVRFSVF